jgi:hypothetical protein
MASSFSQGSGGSASPIRETIPFFLEAVCQMGLIWQDAGSVEKRDDSDLKTGRAFHHGDRDEALGIVQSSLFIGLAMRWLNSLAAGQWSMKNEQ